MLTFDNSAVLPPALPSPRAAAAVLVVAVAAVAPLRVAAPRFDLVQRSEFGNGFALQQLRANKERETRLWRDDPAKKRESGRHVNEIPQLRGGRRGPPNPHHRHRHHPPCCIVAAHLKGSILRDADALIGSLEFTVQRWKQERLLCVDQKGSVYVN